MLVVAPMLTLPPSACAPVYAACAKVNTPLWSALGFASIPDTKMAMPARSESPIELSARIRAVLAFAVAVAMSPAALAFALALDAINAAIATGQKKRMLTADNIQ
jgi:hypothetical protein